MIADFLYNIAPQDGFNVIEFDLENLLPELDPLEELYAAREQISLGYAPEFAQHIRDEQIKTIKEQIIYSHNTELNQVRKNSYLRIM